MDWNYPVSRFFKLTKEKREEYIMELGKFYYQKWVSEENEEIRAFTMLECIETFDKNEERAIKNEDYERAEIFNKLSRIFHINLYENE